MSYKLKTRFSEG